jgi:hypothetical protein
MRATTGTPSRTVAARPVPTAERPAPPAHAVLIVVAVAAGVLAQGGYHPAGRIVVCALALAAALWIAGHTGRQHLPDHGRWLLVAAAALGLWTMLRAAIAALPPHGTGQAVLPSLAALATLAGFVAVPVVTRRLTAPHREWLAGAALALGALVAIGAWIGVAWRVSRLATLVDGRLWRGSSTLTYQNAAAALLVMLAVLAISWRAGAPDDPYRAAVGYLLLVGVGAAASRAGFLALGVGLLALALFGGILATVRRLCAPLLGAAVAVAALTPSFPVHDRQRPGLALVGLLAGAAIAAGPALLAGRLPRRVGLVTATGAAALAVAAIGGGLLVPRLVPADALHAVLASRANLASEGRTGALHAAVKLVEAHPVTGTGVGLARFAWPTANGNMSIALYVHNEYAQLLVDLGAIGLALLAAVLAAVVLFIRDGRRYPQPPGLRAGAIGGLLAFAAHSGFDFLWHIPVLPLVAALLVGLAGPGATEDPIPVSEQEEQ